MKNKFYCYVDETGQDTLGKLFVVGLVLTDSEREKIIKKLETIEKETKKGSVKRKKFISNQLHKLNIKTKKVRSVKKEENDAFLRLADSLAGFIRKVEEKDEKMIKIYQKLIKEKKIFKI